VVFALNEPVLIVAKESAHRLRAFTDLPEARRIVLGAAGVPIGSYTLDILDRASAAYGSDFRKRVEARVVSRELNVRQVLTKVRLGEADAGIVYRSDVLGSGEDVTVVTIPPSINVVAEYPIAIVTGSSQPELARELIEGLASESGRAALARAGFSPPAPRGASP
jgi:molybdate transport system substrate-binding protein